MFYCIQKIISLIPVTELSLKQLKINRKNRKKSQKFRHIIKSHIMAYISHVLLYSKIISLDRLPFTNGGTPTSDPVNIGYLFNSLSSAGTEQL